MKNLKKAESLIETARAIFAARIATHPPVTANHFNDMLDTAFQYAHLFENKANDYRDEARKKDEEF